VLSELTVQVAGMDAVTYRYQYRYPVMHRRGRFLLGYRQISRHGPQSEQTVRMRHADHLVGVPESMVERDTANPGLQRFIEWAYTDQSFAGVRWLRPAFEKSGWREDGLYGREQVVVRTDYKAYEAELCVSMAETHGRDGVLVQEHIRARIPALGVALHCLPAVERERGVHGNTDHDFVHEREIIRNAHGQIVEVRQVGDGQVRTAYRVDYDADRRVHAVHEPGRGTAQIRHDDSTGLLRVIVSPAGAARRVIARDPVSDGVRALRDDRGPDGVLISFSHYDPFGRLEAAWRDMGGSSESLPDGAAICISQPCRPWRGARASLGGCAGGHCARAGELYSGG
jgi:hypothetical protein